MISGTPPAWIITPITAVASSGYPGRRLCRCFGLPDGWRPRLQAVYELALGRDGAKQLAVGNGSLMVEDDELAGEAVSLAILDAARQVLARTLTTTASSWATKRLPKSSANVR